MGGLCVGPASLRRGGDVLIGGCGRRGVTVSVDTPRVCVVWTVCPSARRHSAGVAMRLSGGCGRRGVTLSVDI